MFKMKAESSTGLLRKGFSSKEDSMTKNILLAGHCARWHRQKKKMSKCGPCSQGVHNKKCQIRHIHRKLQYKVECGKMLKRDPAQVPWELRRG
jgi:hypothetical protein